MRFRHLSIFTYGALALVLGLALFGGLTALAVSELHELRDTSEEKHRSAAQEEFHAAKTKLLAAVDALADTFAAWDETLQQINNPTYYGYWRENRAPSANFVPHYFKHIELYGRDGNALATPLDPVVPALFDPRLKDTTLTLSETGPVLTRCRVMNEEFGARDVSGYLCITLDFIKGMQAVHSFRYLDIDTIQVFAPLGEHISLDDLASRTTFSAQSQRELTKMHDLTVDTLGRFLLAGAGAMLFFLYLLAVPIGRPLRRLSQHIDALHTDGTRALELHRPGPLSVAELVKAHSSLNDYQNRLEESAKTLSESEEQFRSLIENSSDVIASLDTKGFITYISPSVERMLGYTPYELLYKQLVNFVHDNDKAEVERALKGFSQEPGVLHIDEFRFRHKDGGWVILEATGKILTGKQSGCIINWRDITERKRSQEALALARDQALAASKAKSSFLANTSHELRTPLNAILGYTEILLEDVHHGDTAGQQADLAKVHAAAKHLLKLINEILDLTKIEAGKVDLELETFELFPLVQEIARTLLPLLKKNHNAFHLDCPEDIGRMYSDPTKLRQILFNLLSNAAKFTHHGTVKLEVRRRGDHGQQQIDFVVSDTGIGMDLKQQNKIFEPFAQADMSSTRRYGGTGLGLTLCRSFVELMGGETSVESQPGRGTTFTVTLPAQTGVTSRDNVHNLATRN